jgi:hypothetical protein
VRLKILLETKNLFARDPQKRFILSLDGVGVFVARQALLGIPAFESVFLAACRNRIFPQTAFVLPALS